jgi:hypothetical protein
MTRKKNTWWPLGAFIVHKKEIKALGGHKVPFYSMKEKKGI